MYISKEILFLIISVVLLVIRLIIDIIIFIKIHNGRKDGEGNEILLPDLTMLKKIATAAGKKILTLIEPQYPKLVALFKEIEFDNNEKKG